MEEYVEYQRFPTVEDAEILIERLNANQISFKIDDSAMRFSLAASSYNPFESGIAIRVREIDKDRIDRLNQVDLYGVEDEHYMYSLSDNDIIDAVVNPEEWTKEEQILAQKILKQRNIQPTAEIIKSSRKEKIETANITKWLDLFCCHIL